MIDTLIVTDDVVASPETLHDVFIEVNSNLIASALVEHPEIFDPQTGDREQVALILSEALCIPVMDTFSHALLGDDDQRLGRYSPIVEISPGNHDHWIMTVSTVVLLYTDRNDVPTLVSDSGEKYMIIVTELLTLDVDIDITSASSIMLSQQLSDAWSLAAKKVDDKIKILAK